MDAGLFPKVGIWEVCFGYNAGMEGYTTSSSDIPKLYAIVSKRLIIRELILNKEIKRYETLEG